MQQPSLSFSTAGAQAESFKNGGAWTNGVKAETERKRQQSVSGEKTCGLTDPAARFSHPEIDPPFFPPCRPAWAVSAAFHSTLFAVAGCRLQPFWAIKEFRINFWY